MGNRIFGKKLGMTRYFIDEGKSVPVTLVKAGPCVVIQKKTVDKDGYEAIQVGFEEKKESRVNKPLKGHQKAAGEKCYYYLREIRVKDAKEYEIGQEITAADIVQIGDKVTVSGTSKGRGYAGVVKRHGFGGGRKTHGSRSHRVPGSIGMCATPSRVLKGRKLPGQMGNDRTTVKNLKVLDVRPEINLIAIRGPLPGSDNSIIEICRL
jgi:large subunit ribosomal protein L3